MPPKKTPRKSVSGSELQKHLDNVKKDLKQLTTKISKANRAELSKLSYDASKTVGDTASEIIKSSSVLLDKAFKVLHGAVEGGKKAMEKEKKASKRAPVKRKTTVSKKKTTSAKKTAARTTAKPKTTTRKKTTKRKTAKK
jgi:hypothetical protein